MHKLITTKKVSYEIQKPLRKYLFEQGRCISLSIDYKDLCRYSHTVPLLDLNDKPTSWVSVSFDSIEQKEINQSLLQVYAALKANGDISILEHLKIDRIDLCLFGNSQPFRIRVLNCLNDNYDYFYIKKADASRIYGLELEHILSPNRISFLLSHDTLIIEHIHGIPGDLFLETQIPYKLNKVRLAKEFVKFNERCFTRLLGDMHSANFVVDVTLDIEDCNYRIRAIDFDQQSYEGRKKVYLPQFYAENSPFVKIGLENLNLKTVLQYQKEERSNIEKRIKLSRSRLGSLLSVMEQEKLAPQEHLLQMRSELANHYKKRFFENCRSMGEVVKKSLEINRN